MSLLFPTALNFVLEGQECNSFAEFTVTDEILKILNTNTYVGWGGLMPE